jgi:hypothetical protein
MRLDEDALLASSCLSTHESMTPTGQIFMKFYIWNFYVNLSRNPIFGYNNSHCTWIPNSISLLLVTWICHNFTVVQKSFLYCWQWHLVQECTENALLPFHCRNCYGNMPQLYTVGAMPIKLPYEAERCMFTLHVCFPEFIHHTMLLNIWVSWMLWRIMLHGFHVLKDRRILVNIWI